MTDSNFGCAKRETERQTNAMDYATMTGNSAKCKPLPEGKHQADSG